MMKEAAISSAMQMLVRLLEARTGQMIAPARMWRIETALKPLMKVRGIADLDALVVQMVSGRDDQLSGAVIDSLLNNETFFFRDQPVFDTVDKHFLEALRERKRDGERRLRIWSAGCSTGQEAYSLAMLFAQQPHRWAGWRIEIVATDISASVLERARRGIFTQFEIQRGLPVMMMLRWFTQSRESWHARPELIQMIDFRQHSLLDPPPRAGKFDIIFCRNVLMYFTPAVRSAVLSRLHGALDPEGLIAFGAGETMLGQENLFRASDRYRGAYRHAGGGVTHQAASGLAAGGGSR